MYTAREKRALILKISRFFRLSLHVTSFVEHCVISSNFFEIMRLNIRKTFVYQGKHRENALFLSQKVA
nr:MAG TPA: hypothetical protein [Bacteriophage sp.]